MRLWGALCPTPDFYSRHLNLSCNALFPIGTCAVLLKDRLKLWRGKLSLKEAAAKLDIDYPSYRKYETGKRTPCKLALREIERRIAQ